MSSSGKPLPVQQTEARWGEFAGTIFRDFTVSYPVTILSGPDERREESLPIVKYSVKGKGLKRRLVSGQTADGTFACDLLPTDAGVLGSPALVGELKALERSIGSATVGPKDTMTELATFRSAGGQWTLNLVVHRPNPAISEGDAVLLDSERGGICILQRRNFTWPEQMNSRLGFGRCKRGVFLDAAQSALTAPDKRFALLFLLVCYFQLLELPFNTDITSS